jgi:hypothetical protein
MRFIGGFSANVFIPLFSRLFGGFEGRRSLANTRSSRATTIIGVITP